MWPCGNCLCDENGIGHGSWSIEGVVDSEPVCARRLITPKTDYLVGLFNHYLRGNLAVEGGVTNQPGIYLEAMQKLSEYSTDGK